MKLTGKKVAFLGDSITQGVGAGDVQNRYTSVFERITNTVVYNYGISGTRIARQFRPSHNPRHDLNFLDRVDEMIGYADIVVVFGGTNDFGHGDAPFGSFESTDEYTFYGALHSLCKRLINKYPDSLIVFLTPLHRMSENSVRTDNVTLNDVEYKGKRPLLKEFVNAINEVCEYYSIPVLDLYSTIGIQPSVEVLKNKFMPDGLHPSAAGASKIAERLAAFLETL